jgi:hypothetical protein
VTAQQVVISVKIFMSRSVRVTNQFNHYISFNAGILITGYLFRLTATKQ